jgi:hypothetical protein
MAAAVACLLAGVAIFICGCLLLWFSCLRENQDFWRNSGGYPVLLRDIVLIVYFPLLAFTLLALITLTLVLGAKVPMPQGLGCLKTLILCACWALVAGSMVISFRNNIANLWSGRPIHEHQNHGR